MSYKHFIMLIALLPVCAFAAGGDASDVYRSPATNSMDMVRTIPCQYARRNADGSWTFPGTIYLGGAQMTGVTFGAGKETVVLDRRCGASH